MNEAKSIPPKSPGENSYEAPEIVELGDVAEFTNYNVSVRT